MNCKEVGGIPQNRPRTWFCVFDKHVVTEYIWQKIPHTCSSLRVLAWEIRSFLKERSTAVPLRFFLLMDQGEQKLLVNAARKQHVARSKWRDLQQKMSLDHATDPKLLPQAVALLAKGVVAEREAGILNFHAQKTASSWAPTFAPWR